MKRIITFLFPVLSVMLTRDSIAQGFHGPNADRRSPVSVPFSMPGHSLKGTCEETESFRRTLGPDLQGAYFRH